MKKKNKLITVVIMLILMMQMTGCGNNNDTWAGYEADAANGLRVRSVTFSTPGSSEVSTVEYRIDGSISSVSIDKNHVSYAPFWEKALGLQIPVMECGDTVVTNEAGRIPRNGDFLMKKHLVVRIYNNSKVNFSITDEGYTFSIVYSSYNSYKDVEQTYYFLANGQLTEYNFRGSYENAFDEDKSYDIDTTETIKYDSAGRRIEMDCTSKYTYKNGKSAKDSYTGKYTYKGDTLYLETCVYESTKNPLDAYKESFEYEYDENNRIVGVKCYARNGNDEAIGGSWEYEYDENGNVACEIRGGVKTRYQYNKDGNVTEECTYKTFGSEEYMTSKIEYNYKTKSIPKIKITSYEYEANDDFSIVNLKKTVEGDWEWDDREFYEGYDEVNDCWTVIYYTQQEIEQYMHDQEFHDIH